MKIEKLKYFDILNDKKAYKDGKNITELLRHQRNIESNTSEIIETAYDLQAGSYIDYLKQNKDKSAAYTNEISQIIDKYNLKDNTLVDIGTGELTTITQILSKLKRKPKKIYAFDISWSRIYKGILYAKEIMGKDFKILRPFVGDLIEIPLQDKSINITTSSHALEPNGGKLKEILLELFRITIDKLILFEPCYEINSEEGKKRMDKLGYIKAIDKTVESLGGEVLDKIKIKNIDNPLNPTVCFIIKPPNNNKFILNQCINESCIYSVPGTNFSLEEIDNFYFSNQFGLCYPKLKSIPILKSNMAILATALCK